MRKAILLLLFSFCSVQLFAQKLLVAWGQKDIQNFTIDVYNAAQKLTAAELLAKNLTDRSWSDVFATLNASTNNFSKDTAYLKALVAQITNNKETTLAGTSRLIIWDRIVDGSIIFEGKGLIIDNDLYKVGGRANQILQSLTRKNFGNVSVASNKADLAAIQQKWSKFFAGEAVDEYIAPEFKNAKIGKFCTLNAVHALIVSLQDNIQKGLIIKNCLKNVYHLDELPADKTSSANYCNPDTYTFSYLGMLFGDLASGDGKDAKWWQNFWENNHSKLIWDDEKGVYQVGK